MIRRPPRSTPLYSSAASDVYKRQGFAVGLETTALPIVSLVVALIVSYFFGTQFANSWNANPAHLAQQITPFIGGIYGTTLATMGMLAVMGMVLALDGFGPIACLLYTSDAADE